MAYKVIIFDMDGVLFDSVKLVIEYFEKLHPGVPPGTHEKLSMGNIHEGLKTVASYKAQRTDEETVAFREEYLTKKAQITMYDGMKKLVHDLHEAGYILNLNTSATLTNCLPSLDGENITALFDFIATKDISPSKAEKFRIIQEKYSVETNEMIFITDTLGDVREAEEVGVPTIAVTWGEHTRSYFTQDTYQTLLGIVDTVPELRALIEAK